MRCSAGVIVAKINIFSGLAKSGCPLGDNRIHREGKVIDLTNNDSLGRRVLCSGSSGMVGTALRESLARSGVDVLQLVRRNPQGPGEIEWNPKAKPEIRGAEGVGEAAAIQGIEGRLEGLEVAVHLSGVNLSERRWTPAYKLEIEASRVESTRVLAAMLARLGRPPKTLLVASATGFYGDRGDEVLDDTDLAEGSGAGVGFLPEICAKWEAASEAAAKAGIRVVHLRLGVVLGREGALKKMLPIFRLGLGGRLGSGQQWMSWIGLGDAVRAIIFAMETETLSGPLNLTAPTPVTNAEFTRALGRALHRPAILAVPAVALRRMFGEMADEALLASTRAVPGKLMAAGFGFEQPTVDEALGAAVGMKGP